MGGTGSAVERGRAALADCRWEDARAAFTEAVAARGGTDPPAEVLDGLGQALYWLGDYTQALGLRARAYAAFRREGDGRRAGITAIRLALLHGLIDGDGVVVRGWVAHARSALGDRGDCAEQGWVELFLACIAEDAAERQRRAREALALARRHGDAALEFDALAYLGQAQVELGDGEGGLRLIDEAVAATMSGLVDDPWATGEIYCVLFSVCEMTVDIRRAEAWLDAVDRYLARTGERPIFAICRMHYGGLLTAAGRWREAERELLTALDVYDHTYVGTRFEPLLRLAELRARQGRLEEAGRLLAGYEDEPGASMARARLLLRRGEARSAVAVLERDLARRAPDLRAARTLALLVDAELAAGHVAAAEACAARLAALGTVGGPPTLRALAAVASARVAIARGAGDAAAQLEAAMSECAEAGLAYEVARVRLELAALLIPDRPDVARTEARLALEAFERLDAVRDADEAASLLRRLGDTSRTRPRTPGPLTPREQEVLAGLAEGLRNADIAERLFISHRTVEHHVSNILAKLGARSRAEAVASLLREPPAGQR